MYRPTYKLFNFIRSEEGLTTVEYAVAGTLIGLAVVAAFSQLGNSVGNAINEIENVIEPPAAP